MADLAAGGVGDAGAAGSRDAARSDARRGTVGRKRRGRFRLIADTLSGRLVLIFTLLILPPTVASLFLAWNSFTEQKARAKLQVKQFATLTATYESKFFDDVRKTLERLGGEDVIRNGGGGECAAILKVAQERTPQFASIDYFDSAGRRICGSGAKAADLANQEWLDEARRYHSFAISNYTVTPNSPFPVIYAAQAVYGPDWRVVGVLTASIRLYWLSAFIQEISLPPESVFYLIDSNGNILADRSAITDSPGQTFQGSGFAPAGAETLSGLVRPAIATAILNGDLTDFEVTGADDVRRVFSSVALPHGGVTVLFGIPANSAFGWLELDLLFRVLGLAAIVLGGVGAAWLGTRYLVTRWTSALRDLARSYGRADYDRTADLARAPRELRDLGETLTTMAKRVEQREEELRASLRQKDMLLREIHHRVKNNLQIVGSLLNIRTGGVTGAEEHAALGEVKAHVRALALVHRHLYEGDDVSRVNLRSFMTELCRSAVAGLSAGSQRVTLNFEIPDFMISTDRAIPIALMVTEAITNSLKHAFPDGRAGTIRVAFEPSGAETGVLVVEDDGVGFPTDAPASGGLGLQLIEAFARQIGGEVRFSGPPGAAIRVTVDDRTQPDDEPEEAVDADVAGAARLADAGA